MVQLIVYCLMALFVAVSGQSLFLFLYPPPPASPSFALLVEAAISSGDVQSLVAILNEAEANAQVAGQDLAAALTADGSGLLAKGLGQAIDAGGSAASFIESSAVLAAEGYVETLSRTWTIIAGQGSVDTDGQAVVSTVKDDIVVADAVGQAIVAAAKTDIVIATQAISSALSNLENAVAFAESISDALATGENAVVTAVAEAITQAFDGGVTEAIGQSIQFLCGFGYASAAAQSMATAVQGGQAQAVSQSLAYSYEKVPFLRALPQENYLTGLADACAQACNQGVDVAESVADALLTAIFNRNITAVAESNPFNAIAFYTGQSFVAAGESANGQAFIARFAEIAAQGNCPAAARILAEASHVEEGNSQAVADAQAAAECLNVPLILVRPADCSRWNDPCEMFLEAPCCVPNITSLLPGVTCNIDGYLPFTYQGKCAYKDAIQVKQNPNFAGCTCPV